MTRSNILRHHRRKLCSFVFSKVPDAKELKKDNQFKNCVSYQDYTDEDLEQVMKIKNCTNFYQVLSVSRDFTETDIRKSYKKLAVKLHPDKNHAPGAEEAFKTLTNALTVLTDAQTRDEYDWANNLKHNDSANHPEPSACQRIYKTDYHYALLLIDYYQKTFENQRKSEDHNQQQSSVSGNGDFFNKAINYIINIFNQSPYQRKSFYAFGLLLVLTLLLMCLFFPGPAYSLQPSRKFSVPRVTTHSQVPYFVKENFKENVHLDSLALLEHSVVQEYIRTMAQNCIQELSNQKSELKRNIGIIAQFIAARRFKTPSCFNLIRITTNPLYTFNQKPL